MTRTYKYRIEQLTPAPHGALKAMFRHLGWLRSLVIERYRERGKGTQASVASGLCEGCLDNIRYALPDGQELAYNWSLEDGLQWRRMAPTEGQPERSAD